MPSRRDLMRWTVAAGLTACGRPPKAPDLQRGDAIQAMAAALVAYFADLQLPAETLTAFLDAHVGHGRGMPPEGSGRTHFFLRFLMSTDFFPNDERTDRPLGFLAYYDPYLTPCYNPLQRNTR